MKTSYPFDIKEFRKRGWLPILAIICPIQLALDLLVLQNGKWSPAVGLVLLLISGLVFWAFYAQRKLLWKTAYLAVHNGKLVFYRVPKNSGHTEAFRFEERTAVIHKVVGVKVSWDNIIITGEIIEQVRTNPTSGTFQSIYAESVKIPRYFRDLDALIQQLNSTYK